MEENIFQQQSEVIQTSLNNTPNSGWKSKIFLICAGFLLFILIGAGGFFLGKSLSQPKTFPPSIFQVSPSPSPENPIPTPSPTIDPIAHWKTYINNKYNYSIKYPPEYSFIESSTDYVRFFPVINNINTPQSETYLSIQLDENSQQIQQATYKKTSDGKTLRITKVIMDIDKNKKSQIEANFDLILSTFKFLDPTANWKTYTNNELSFKYPPSWTAETHRIIANNPNIVIYIAAGGSTLMNECMKLEKIEKKDNLVIKKFAGITAGEMCSTNDVNSREIWIIPSENAYSPGISYNYSTKDNPQAEDLFDLILSTFKFLD